MDQSMNTNYVPPMDDTIPQNPSVRKNKGTAKKNDHNQIASSKRNAEQNIVNQFFSFNHNNSETPKIIKRVLRSMKIQENIIENIIPFILKLLRVLNNIRKRKYINRKFLNKLFFPE